MATLTEIDACIRTTQADLERCNHLAKPSLHSSFDGDAMSAATLAERRLRELHQERTRLLAGETEPPAPAPAPAALRMTATDSKDLPPLTAAQRDQIVTFGMLLSAVDGIAPAVRDYVQEGLAPLAQRIAALEGRRVPAADGQATSALDLDPDLNPVNRELIEGCVAHVKEVTAPLLARLETLERREVLAFRGVWRSSGAPYPRGSMCSHSGGLWHANSPTSSRPGADGSWTLAVKKGSAGDAV